MKRISLGAVALVFLMSITGIAFAQFDSIDYIQEYTSEGVPISPENGNVVTVQGVVYVVKGTYNGGTHYIQGDDGGINFYYPAAQALTYGDVVQVTGTVNGDASAYGQEINIDPTNIVFVSAGPEVEPIPATISQLKSDYEWVGNLVQVIGTITDKASSSFNITDGDSTILVYIDGDTGINLGAVDVGDEYAVTSPCITYNGLIELKPRRQGDLVEDPAGDTLPVIDDINCVNWMPKASDPITVTATITDDFGVSSATLYYRDDAGDSTGTFLSVAMGPDSGDTWSGTIPGGFTGRQVDFYVSASDGVNETVSNPGDAPAGWYEVAVGFTPIYDVQYVHPDSSYQGSPLLGKVTNIHGIVTAGTDDFGSTNSKIVVQDAYGAFNGILVYEGSASGYFLPGDEVEVGGYVDEYFGLTELQAHNGNSIYLKSYENNWFPAVQVGSTADLADDNLEDGDGIFGEAYESVWVCCPVSTVIDTTGVSQYGTFMISDTGAQADSLVVDPYMDLYYQADIGDVVRILGFMQYDYGTFELVPIRDDEVVLDPNSAVETPSLTKAGGFTSISPNPFNPQTEIKFYMTRDNVAQLNIYNIRGEVVSSLLNGRLDGGQEHVYKWDGTNRNGHRVASGTYFARLRIGSEVLQVRKLALVK